jgi:hypothetical protein
MDWKTLVFPLGFISAGIYFYYLSEKLSKQDDSFEDDEIIANDHVAVRAAGVIFAVIGFAILGIWLLMYFSKTSQ